MHHNLFKEVSTKIMRTTIIAMSIADTMTLFADDRVFFFEKLLFPDELMESTIESVFLIWRGDAQLI